MYPVPTIVDGNSEVNVSDSKKAVLCYMIAVRAQHGNEQAAHLLSSTLNEQMRDKHNKITNNNIYELP